MKTCQKDLELFEELLHWGTALEPTVVEEARVECRGLQITQSGNCWESVVYAKASGGVGIIVSVEIENISDRIIRVDAVRLEMPWPDADFHWLEKPSAKEMREWGGYVLSASGTCGYDSSVVLNHRFGRKLFPRDSVEGLLLGEGSSSVPDNYCDRRQIPKQLVVFAGRGERFEVWVNLMLSREVHRPSRRSSSRRVALFSQPDKVLLER
jgi:hypothetical protein